MDDYRANQTLSRPIKSIGLSICVLLYLFASSAVVAQSANRVSPTAQTPSVNNQSALNQVAPEGQYVQSFNTGGLPGGATSGGYSNFGLNGQLPGVGEIPTTRQVQTDFAQQQQTAANDLAIRNALSQRGTVSFLDTPMNQVLYTLSEQWSINIVAGSSLNGSATGTFRNAPLSEILDAILSANNLGYRQNGSSLIVLEQSAIGAGSNSFQADTISVPRNLPPESITQIADALAVLSSPQGGRIQPIPASSQILVYDSPERIEQMRSMLGKLVNGNSPLPPATDSNSGGGIQLGTGRGLFPAPAANDILKIRCQYVPVQSVAQAVQLAVQNNAAISILESEQTLLVSGPVDALHRAEKVAAAVDLPRTQVRITSYIYDISLGELERIGVDWSSQTLSQAVDANGLPINNIRADSGLLARSPPTLPVQALDAAASAATAGGAAAAATTGGPTGAQWFFRTLSSNFELNTVIQALDETNGAKLLADPHITVVDRETASISIVTKIPVQQLTQTQQGGAIGTTAFEEAGIKLNVTPQIANDRTIQLLVEPEFSTLSGFNNGNPVIDTRKASTVVRVADQNTIVLGGLRQKTAVETIRGIPGLMNAKFIGRLFRTHNTEIRESELVVFIQPEIIDFNSAGLPREEIALEVAKSTLSQIPTACAGPHVPDCLDPFCPIHHPRPRINGGLPDQGFVHPNNFYQQPRVLSNEFPEPIILPDPPATELKINHSGFEQVESSFEPLSTPPVMNESSTQPSLPIKNNQPQIPVPPMPTDHPVVRPALAPNNTN